jgi:hypothetical protein
VGEHLRARGAGGRRHKAHGAEERVLRRVCEEALEVRGDEVAQRLGVLVDGRRPVRGMEGAREPVRSVDGVAIRPRFVRVVVDHAVVVVGVVVVAIAVVIVVRVGFFVIVQAPGCVYGVSRMWE